MITSKQRAYLRSLSNGLDTVLMVGKFGISDDVIKSADEVLTKRELIKGKVLETCAKTPKEIACEIAEETNSIVVHVIGSKFVLYRKNEKDPQIVLPKVKKQS